MSQELENRRLEAELAEARKQLEELQEAHKKSASRLKFFWFY